MVKNPKEYERPKFGSHQAAGFSQPGIFGDFRFSLDHKVGLRSSSSLLEQLRQRNSAPLTGKKRTSQHMTFAQDVLNLMKANENGVQTKVILRNFESKLRTEHDQYVFRQLLQKMCFKKKSTTRQGKLILWFLKPEFKEV